MMFSSMESRLLRSATKILAGRKPSNLTLGSTLESSMTGSTGQSNTSRAQPQIYCWRCKFRPLWDSLMHCRILAKSKTAELKSALPHVILYDVREEGRHASSAEVFSSKRIRPIGCLDAYDVSPLIGQHHGSVRSCDDRREIDDTTAR